MLSPYPIKLSIGTLIKPTLKQIFDPVDGIGYEQYRNYEAFTKLTPKLFYTKMDGEEGLAIWESFTDAQKSQVKMFNVIKSNEQLLHDYLDLFNFFFMEHVSFEGGFFVWSNRELDFSNEDESFEDAITGVINTPEMFEQVIEAIQQVCCAYSKSESDEADESGLKFKNELAKQMYEKMHKTQKSEGEDETENANIDSEKLKNFNLPNIISAVSNNHLTISPINVWDLTVFQLLDAFHRKRATNKQTIDSLRVAVWGDEENVYDPNVWLANEYE
jgi:hypothetical protein